MRRDIQALRGLAILLVLIHHSQLLPALKAGYLGVDIFFVVSGFLITGIVVRALQSGRFSFAEFYGRRAKRLLPAAYVSFILTAAAAPIFLTAAESTDFVWQLAGAVTFTGNIVLWMQTGYFEGAAQLKPLLHVWSLALEEQYYLLLPAAFVLVPARYWKALVLCSLTGSLLVCLLLTGIEPGASFYLLPTRAWELALGSVGVLLVPTGFVARQLASCFWPAICILLAIPFMPAWFGHPGPGALAVCFATLIVILRNHQSAAPRPLLWPLVWFGNISYSLYLVHWPLLAFVVNAWVSPVPGVVRLGAVVLAVVLAWALYRCVERPFRDASVAFDRRFAISAVGASFAVLGTGVGAQWLQSGSAGSDFVHAMRPNRGLSDRCEFDDVYQPRSECQTGRVPRVLVWGDSYAMHLVEGILASTDDQLMQATRTTCGPFMGISMYDESGFYNRNWARKCIRFNADVLAHLAEQQSVEVVVLSSLYGQVLPFTRVLRERAGSLELEAQFVEEPASAEVAAEALRRTIESVRALGKRVVLVAPPPSAAGVNFGRCLERVKTHKAVFGSEYPTCEISRLTYHRSTALVRALLDRVAVEADVSVFSFEPFLCEGERCAVEINGVPIYRDNGHLSYAGSELLGRKLGFAARLDALAR